MSQTAFAHFLDWPLGSLHLQLLKLCPLPNPISSLGRILFTSVPTSPSLSLLKRKHECLCSCGPSPSVESEKLTWKPSPGPHPSQPEARPTRLLLRAHLHFQEPRLLGPSLLLSPSSTCPAARWFSAPPRTEPPTLLPALVLPLHMQHPPKHRRL